MTESESKTNTASPERNEWKVLLVLAMSFLVMEGVVRGFAGALSTDLRNILATGETASRIRNAPEDVRKVLVVGNSLARCGVDPELLGDHTAWPEDAGKRSTMVEFFTPDASSVANWDWGLRRYFANAGAHPDVIILVSGETHLLDLPVPPETLGAYYVGTPDLAEAIKSMQGGENTIRLLIGTTSHLQANRERIRNRIGYSYIPGFEAAWPRLISMAGSDAANPGQLSGAITTKSLGRLIATAKGMGSELRVISVPMPAPYELPEPVILEVGRSGVAYYDLSGITGIGAANFPDAYHLDESGASIFTRAILQSLDR